MAADEIDPQFPFVQFHRSAQLAASQIATLLKLPVPHVVGGLVCFWFGLADRRILAKHPDGVVLSSEEIQGRMELAFGVSALPLRPFVLAGLLEERDGGNYRVRGMSRYLDAEAKRSKLKGTATSKGGSGGVELRINPTEERGERKEVRGKKKEGKDLPVEQQLPGIPQPEPRERKRSLGERLHEHLQIERRLAFSAHGAPFEPDKPATVVLINTWAAQWVPAMLQARFGPDDMGLSEDEVFGVGAEALGWWVENSNWGAQCSPPWPFNAYASRKVWEPALQDWARACAQKETAA